jgi:hypothetical protein
MQINRYQLDVKVQNKTTKYEGSKIRTLHTFNLTFLNIYRHQRVQIKIKQIHRGYLYRSLTLHNQE